MVELEVYGIQEIITKLDNLTTHFDYNVDKAIGEGAALIYQNAYALCPVKTGALRNSIKINHNGLCDYSITAGGIEAFYGIFQERGFIHHWSGKFIINPFMYPALLLAEDDIRELVKQAISW